MLHCLICDEHHPIYTMLNSPTLKHNILIYQWKIMKHLLIGICFIVIILITSITPPQAHCSTMTTTPKIISVSKDTFNLTQYRLKNEALKWVGYKETGNNRGKDVDSWNHYCGVALGSPYCSSFVSYLIRLCKIILNNVSNYKTARAKD